MKCPFCGEEMVHGYLYSGQGSGFPWYPDGEKPTRYVPDIRLMFVQMYSPGGSSIIELSPVLLL